MRLIRFGPEPTTVGADVRAALSACGPGQEVLGGIALIGGQPAGCHRPLDALVLLPRGVLVVFGVDLPDPAMRLQAPLDDVWKVDNWDLVRPDGTRNPGSEALAASASVVQRFQVMRTEPLPVATVIAVGPYVGQVVQPTSDLNRGVRVLHPSAGALLTAARELATMQRPCSIEQAKEILAAVGHRGPALADKDLAAEGFPAKVTANMAAASTLLIPRVGKSGASAPGAKAAAGARPQQKAAQPQQAGGGVHPASGNPAKPGQAPRPAPRTPQARPPASAGGRPKPGASGTAPGSKPAPGPGRRKRSVSPKMLTYGGIGIAGLLLLLVGSLVLRSCTSGAATSSGPNGASQPTVVDGVRFIERATAMDDDCTGHSFGDLRVWLTQHACRSLTRWLYQADRKAAAASLAVVQFDDDQLAEEFRRTLSAPGVGGIADLTREGKTWSGGPKSFDDGAFAIVRQGTQVKIGEAVFLDGPSQPDSQDLVGLTNRVVKLPNRM